MRGWFREIERESQGEGRVAEGCRELWCDRLASHNLLARCIGAPSESISLEKLS